MSVGEQPRRSTSGVGFVGLDAVGLFLFERFSLFPEPRWIGVYDDDPKRLHLVSGTANSIWHKVASAVESKDADLLIFASDSAFHLIERAIQFHKRTVISAPWLLTSRQLLRLSEAAAISNLRATYACLPRSSADFAAALAAKQSGRLGTLQFAQTLNFQICLAESLPGSAWREPCFHWLDHFLVLSDSPPIRVCAKIGQTPDSSSAYSLTILLECADGCAAQLELRTNSRLSLRTGWMLEGTLGSYRNHRMYTTMPDGEIVDEPFPSSQIPHENFVELLSGDRHEPNPCLPSLTDAAYIVQLIDRIEDSARTGEVVPCE